MAEDETPSEAEPRGGRRKFAQDFARKYSRIATPASASKAQILKRQEELLKKDPNNVGVWFARALLLYDLGEYAEALNCLDRVLDLDPKFPGLYAARAEVLTKLGQPEGAAESMRHALEDVAAGADEGYLRALKDRTPLHEILERGLADLEREVARAEEEERAALRGMPPRLAEEDLLGRLEEEARGPPPGPRPPEPAPREPDTRERLAAWRREGFDVRPLERLLGRDPARASQAFAVFAANVEKARALQVQLGKLRRPGQEERIREALDLLRRPYDLPVYESDINDLIAGKAAPRTTEPGSKPRTRGMVNGLGRTNGLTNGMRGRTNGLVNGLRGRTNGLTNGLTNGRRGRVNGVGGRVNGLTNGMRGRTNGLVNGLRSARFGLTNGLTNGIGMTNGIGAVRSQREIRAARWKLYVVLALAVALLAVPLFSEPSLTGRLPESLITVDGTIGSDWDVATAHRVRHQENFSLLANGDIVETGLLEGVTKFGAFVRLRGDALQGSAVLGTEDTIWVFLDTDQNASTGYGVSGLGAERLVEVRGLSGTVSSALLHAYLAADGIDWFGWRAIAPVEAAVRGGILEFKFDRGALDATASPEVFVQAQAWTGRTDASDTNLALAPGRLALTWRSLAPAVVLPGVRADFLEITATALDAPVTLTRLAVTAVGTILPSSLDEVPPELVEAGGAPLGGTRTGGRTTFSPARLVDAGTSATFTLSAGPGAGSGGRTLGFVLGSVDDVGVDSGSITAAALPSARGLAHVTAPPPGTVRIDGAFGDWTPQPVTVGDVSTGGNGDIDLVSVATQVRSPSPGTSQVYAYAEVAGDLFSGTALPTRPFRRSTQAVVPDADRDTAPDLIDLFPFDFNNDGVPDNQTAGDVDGDGFLDAPAGPDLYLQTTLPGSFPSPYGGKFVRIYIGPIERPPLTGEDALRVYLDA
ncbi:MAG TPA: tetratricopeptide repeat protein, partial [Thermoplasmata archaeon]|nr:tetratricopeptide repeat protein [Thermoplasmata archaeon]